MASIENVRGASDEELRATLQALDDGGLLAQEFTQKGALHAVQFLIKEPGNTYQNVKLMQASLEHYATLISEECARRGLPVVSLE